MSIRTVERFRQTGRLKTIRLSYRTMDVKLDVEKLIEGSRWKETPRLQGESNKYYISIENGHQRFHKDEDLEKANRSLHGKKLRPPNNHDDPTIGRCLDLWYSQWIDGQNDNSRQK